METSHLARILTIFGRTSRNDAVTEMPDLEGDARGEDQVVIERVEAGDGDLLAGAKGQPETTWLSICRMC